MEEQITNIGISLTTLAGFVVLIFFSLEFLFWVFGSTVHNGGVIRGMVRGFGIIDMVTGDRCEITRKSFFFTFTYFWLQFYFNFHGIGACNRKRRDIQCLPYGVL